MKSSFRFYNPDEHSEEQIEAAERTMEDVIDTILNRIEFSTPEYIKGVIDYAFFHGTLYAEDISIVEAYIAQLPDTCV